MNEATTVWYRMATNIRITSHIVFAFQAAGKTSEY